MYNCEICGGSGIVRFPIRKKLNTYPEDYSTIRPISIREYPCPECSEKIPLDKIEIVQVEEHIPLEYKTNFDLLEYIKHSMAAQIGDFLYKEEMITYTNRKDLLNRSKSIRAKLGILSPRQVKTFEEKVRERQIDVATSLVNEVVQSIRNWGSVYDLADISKTQVIRFLYETLDKVKK
jgi:hypothetical protein